MVNEWFDVILILGLDDIIVVEVIDGVVVCGVVVMMFDSDVFWLCCFLFCGVDDE